MNKIRRTNQGGSIVAFVIISAILALGVIGLIYYLNERGEQVRREKAIAAAEAEIEKNKNNEEVVDEEEVVIINDADPKQTVTEPHTLPATGPEMNIVGMSGMFFLTVSTTSYLSSRKLAKRYL